jgi:hypothetical protein
MRSASAVLVQALADRMESTPWPQNRNWRRSGPKRSSAFAPSMTVCPCTIHVAGCSRRLITRMEMDVLRRLLREDEAVRAR